MNKMTSFINRRLYNSVSVFQAFVTLIKQLFSELKEPSPKIVNARSKYKTMIAALDDEQISRIQRYVTWLQIVWIFDIAGLTYSLVRLDPVSSIYFTVLSAWTYIFLGYRIWILKMHSYPGFKNYVTAIYKSPLAPIPYNKKFLKDL